MRRGYVDEAFPRGIKVASEISVNERRIIKSSLLVVFAASLQCTDEVKVVSRGTPVPLSA